MIEGGKTIWKGTLLQRGKEAGHTTIRGENRGRQSPLPVLKASTIYGGIVLMSIPNMRTAEKVYIPFNPCRRTYRYLWRRENPGRRKPPGPPFLVLYPPSQLPCFATPVQLFTPSGNPTHLHRYCPNRWRTRAVRSHHLSVLIPPPGPASPLPAVRPRPGPGRSDAEWSESAGASCRYLCIYIIEIGKIR